MAPKKAVMKTVMKAASKASAKGKQVGAGKSSSSSGNPSLTKESLRAHEALIAKNFKTPDEIIEYMDKLTAKDKEQIWKQSLFCI